MRQTANTKKPINKANTLETYLKSCPINKDGEHFDVYNFEEATDAYEFGQKLRKIAMDIEGVNFADQLQRFEIDISYKTVRIKLLEGELVAAN